MISDEEYRERIRAYAAATGITMAQFGKGMRRLTEVMTQGAKSMRLLTQITGSGAGQDGTGQEGRDD